MDRRSGCFGLRRGATMVHSRCARRVAASGIPRVVSTTAASVVCWWFLVAKVFPPFYHFLLAGLVTWRAVGLCGAASACGPEVCGGLCAKGATHPSLGRSPRERTKKRRGLKARSMRTAPATMGRAFSPLPAIGANLGLCPRLEWLRAFGPRPGISRHTPSAPRARNFSPMKNENKILLRAGGPVPPVEQEWFGGRKSPGLPASVAALVRPASSLRAGGRGHGRIPPCCSSPASRREPARWRQSTGRCRRSLRRVPRGLRGCARSAPPPPR